MPELDPEDLKIVTLARATMQRAHVPHTGVREGAAVRDTDGRTYAAATVENADPDFPRRIDSACTIARISVSVRWASATTPGLDCG